MGHLLSKFNISVVIPCFNAAPFLEECLNSVLTQTLPAREIILVNDGSTDASLQVAQSFGNKIKIISQTNQGVSAARNRGIQEAQEPWIAIQDADDIWDPKKLELQVEAILNSKNNPVCCYTDFFLFGEGRERENCSRPENHLEEHAFAYMLSDWSVTSNAALFRTDVAKKILFPLGIQDCEDTIFFALLRKAGSFLRIAKPLAGYRKGPHQRTAISGQEWLGIKALVTWALQHKDEFFTGHEYEIFSKLILSRILIVYQNAFWARDWKTARDCRKLFFRIRPNARVSPPKEFKKVLLPRSLFLLKDRLHRAFRT